MSQPRYATVLPVLFAFTLLGCPKAVEPTKCDANCEMASMDSGPEDAGPQDAGPPPCAPGLTMCNGACTDLTADINNCSACGMACPSNNTCNASVCNAIPTTCPAAGCPTGAFCRRNNQCGVGCVGDSDCAATQICSSNKCVTGCRTDMSCGATPYVCNGTSCSLPCTDDSTCQSGTICNTNDGHCLAGNEDAGFTYPAPFATPPQVVTSHGPILAMPKLIPVFFPNGIPDGGVGGDSAGDISSMTSFVDGIGASTYWSEAMTEWGVGVATGETPINATSDDLATISAAGVVADADIESWIGQKLATDATWPQPDANTVFVIFFPPGITVTIPSQTGGTSQSCQEFGGYHSNLTVGAGGSVMNVAYAVIPHCGNFDGFTGIQALTGTASHEIAEASSDPYPSTDPAFSSVDNAHLYWEFVLGGGEIGDMCAQDPQAFNPFPPFPFTVQRIWSNKAAKAGTDPCIPELPMEVYFNSAAEMNDVAEVSLGGAPIALAVAHIPLGGTKTIPIDLFSEGPTTGPWSVTVNDWSSFTEGPKMLDITQDKMGGSNGDKIQVTISPTSAAAQAQGGLEFLFIVSNMGGPGGWTHYWVGAVSN